MTQVAVRARSRSRTFRALRGFLSDALYRGSLTLLVNTLAVSAIGFAFWTLAARTYPASTVGVFSSLVSGAGLLAAIAALGLPNVMIRHVSGAANPLGLVGASVTAIATVGTVLCLVTVLALGPHLPSSLHLDQHVGRLVLIVALVVLTAVSGTFDAALIATRATHAVLIKNVAGSVAKIAALYLLTGFRSSGLLIAYSLGLALTTLLGGIALGRRLSRDGASFRPFRVPRRYLSLTSGNYLATIMGILPVSLVPIEVLLALGAAQTARFAVAFLIAGFLNVIPSTVAQVLFAEASRRGVTLGAQLRHALQGVYGLLLPTVAVVVAAAPLALRIFGAAYAAAATGCLRILGLAALLMGGTYIVDAILIARDRIKAYVFINGANAVLVLGCVWVLLRHGLTGAAAGWALAQGLSLILGLILVATGKAGRHHAQLGPARSPASRPGPELAGPARVALGAIEPRIRELLAERPAMPTTRVAERIGWDRPTRALLELVTELRPTSSDRYQRMVRADHPAGKVAQCGVWFPPVEIPVGFGQSRAARQLPVLTMITGYSRWLSAVLIPSLCAEDLIAGLWELTVDHGGTPQILTWDDEYAVSARSVGEPEVTWGYRDFCRAVGARCVVQSPAHVMARGLAELAGADLERAFLPGRAFASPTDFNFQLAAWLAAANARPGGPLDRAPDQLVGIDRQAMLPLPSVPPPAGWRLPLRIGSQAFIRFDSNVYSVHRAALGRRVELVADLRRIRVLCNGHLVADHARAWAHGGKVIDRAHLGPERYPD